MAKFEPQHKITTHALILQVYFNEWTVANTTIYKAFQPPEISINANRFKIALLNVSEYETYCTM